MYFMVVVLTFMCFDNWLSANFDETWPVKEAHIRMDGLVMAVMAIK